MEHTRVINNLVTFAVFTNSDRKLQKVVCILPDVVDYKSLFFKSSQLQLLKCSVTEIT